MAIIKQLTPEIATYILIGIFTLSGLSKFGNTRKVQEMFPRLPTNFWKLAGMYEIGIVVLWYLQKKYIYLMMSFVYLGGVLFASAIMKDLGNSTQLQKTTGLILIPPIITILSALTLGEQINLEPLHYGGAMVGGAIFGWLLSTGKIKL